MYPIVSIIVPVYKVESYLRRCIKSILAQTYSHWELILVDDGSPDNCPKICDEYAIQEKRIKVIHKTNGGLSDARNHGLDIATGDYILFVDSDDYIHHNMVRTMVDYALNNNADIVQCSYMRGVEERFPDIKEKEIANIYDNHTIFSSIQQSPILCSKLYRHSLWNGIRMPVGITHEDEAPTWKLYYRSKRTIAIDTPYYYYYKNPHGIMGCEARRFNPILVKIYNERISYFEEQGENTLAKLSRWQFCLPLAYLNLRGNITKEEERHIQQLLKKNIKKFIRCSQVPLTHRCAFTIIGLCPALFRVFFRAIGKAHTTNGQVHNRDASAT